MTKIKFLKAMKKITNCYLKDMTEEQLSTWYEHFKDIDYELIMLAIDEIIKESKNFPNISIILERCEEISKTQKIRVLRLMEKEGYFKSLSEFEKSLLFIEKNCIPKWLKRDMDKYRFKNEISEDNIKLITN